MNKFAKLTAIATLLAGAAGLATAQTDVPSVSRATVAAEAAQARASGYIEAMVGEDSGSAWLSRQAFAATARAPQAAAATADGELAAALIGEDSASFYLSAKAAGSTSVPATTVAGGAAGK